MTWSVTFGNPRRVCTLTIGVEAPDEATAKRLAMQVAAREGIVGRIWSVRRSTET